MKPVNKTYALITGGSTGIGFELAKLFATDGHNLIIIARDSAELENARTKLNNGSIDVITLSKDL